MRDEDNPTGRGDGSLNNSNYVGNRETGEERPHREVLEASRRRWELVAKRIVFHVDAHQVIETRGWEAENP